MYVFTAVLVAFKRAALPGYFQSNRRVLWVKRKKKSDHTSIQHPSCVFFPFFSLTRLLFTCPLLTRCWSHNGTDVYMYTHGRTQPHKRRREPTSTHKKILLLLFISSWRRIYLSIYIYIHINITEEPPALASWCPGPPFCLVPLYHRLWWFPLTTDDDKEKRACLCKNGADLSSFYVLFCTHFFITRGCCFFFFFDAPILCVAWRCQVECSCRSLAQRWQQ